MSDENDPVVQVIQVPAPLHITPNEEDDRPLAELRLAITGPQRTRDRAHMLRLNAQGWTVPAIAEIFECHPHTVRTTLRRWEADRLSRLWEAPGRGNKATNRNGKRTICVTSSSV